jgi:hypothetical protein
MSPYTVINEKKNITGLLNESTFSRFYLYVGSQDSDTNSSAIP